MKNLTIKIKYLLAILALTIIPISKEAVAQFIDIPEGEVVDVPVVKLIDNNSPVDFSINKKEFTAGEKIEARAIFYNQTQQPLVGRIIVIVSPLDKSFPAKPFLKEFNLLVGEKTQDFISEMSIEDWMPAGIYKAEVEVRNAKDHLIYERFEFFEVLKEEEINNKIEAVIQICADESCSKKRTVFGKDETVYFKLDIAIQDARVNATIKTPDGKIEVLNFENSSSLYSLKNAKEGNYSLWVNLSKEGCKNRRIEKRFILEEDYTEAEFKSICKIDGKCDGEENEINCPKDCEIKDKKNYDKVFNYILYGIIFIVIVFVVKIFIKKKKNFYINK